MSPAKQCGEKASTPTLARVDNRIPPGNDQSSLNNAAITI
jgi:hypothetical protein